MSNEQRSKIALVNPPLLGHKYRGTGTYTKRLYQALKKHSEVDISLVNTKDNLEEFDLVHYPYFDPFFLTLPLIKKKPTVVTVHDLIPRQYPKFFPPGIKGLLKWQIQKLALRRSTAVITVSYASKEDIMRFTGISEDKIHVIYLGVGGEFKVIKSEEFLENVRSKLKLPREFILYVGDVNYNKNIPGLIKAFNIVNKSRLSLHLVLVGNGFVTPSAQLAEILHLINGLRIGDKVYRLGHVTTSDLVGVYNLAKVYLQPSLAEGFGLPVLEAMACGCPVVASNLSSLREIIGNAAIKLNPYNIEEIADNIARILSNDLFQRELIEKGLNRAKLFSWEKSAKETLQIYKSII